MVAVVIHTNIRPATPQERLRGLKVGNQVETAQWLREGFARHGIDAQITADRLAPGDIHVVQGPHYCYREWVGKPNVLFLDRCFYGDSRFNISLGWLNPDGSRDFGNKGMAEGKGVLPELKSRKEYRGSCIVFGDYGRDMREEIYIARRDHQRVYFRPHPADHADDSPVLVLRGELRTLLDFADAAVGHSSTVLVDCELNGLHVTSTDPNHVVHHDGDREQWLCDLSWAQWSHEELKSGAFWEHLKPCKLAA